MDYDVNCDIANRQRILEPASSNHTTIQDLSGQAPVACVNFYSLQMNYLPLDYFANFCEKAFFKLQNFDEDHCLLEMIKFYDDCSSAVRKYENRNFQNILNFGNSRPDFKSCEELHVFTKSLAKVAESPKLDPKPSLLFETPAEQEESNNLEFRSISGSLSPHPPRIKENYKSSELSKSRGHPCSNVSVNDKILCVEDYKALKSWNLYCQHGDEIACLNAEVLKKRLPNSVKSELKRSLVKKDHPCFSEPMEKRGSCRGQFQSLVEHSKHCKRGNLKACKNYKSLVVEMDGSWHRVL